MKFITVLPSILITSALASPAAKRGDAPVKSMMATVPEWTIENMIRCCDDEDTECTWYFTIDTNVPGVPETPCSMLVEAADEYTPASETNGGPVSCGVFTVTSGWSGYFGPGNGFTVLSVVDYATGMIVWPGYTDKQVEDGEVVVPDQSYLPASLP